MASRRGRAPAHGRSAADCNPHTAERRGWNLQLTCVPTFNVQVSLQYVCYNKFNGASTNYDSAGRSASDNNTLYLALWLLW